MRCCKRRLKGKQVKCNSIIDKTKLRSKHAAIKITQLVQLLENLRRSAYMSSTRRLSFDDLDNYTNTGLLNLPGLTKQQFEKLVEMVSTLKKSRSPRFAFGVLLGFIIFQERQLFKSTQRTMLPKYLAIFFPIP